MDFFREYLRDLFFVWYSLVFAAVGVWQFIAVTWPQLHLPNIPVGTFFIMAAGCFMVLQGIAYYRKWIQLIPKLEITFDRETCIKTSGDRILQLCIENHSAVAVEGVRIELISMSPQPLEVTWLPKTLHWVHDRTRGIESQYGGTIPPYGCKYVGVVQQFGSEPKMCVIPDIGITDDPLFIPFQRYKLTVQATAHNSTPDCKTLPIVINQHNMIDMFFLERCESRKGKNILGRRMGNQE